MGRRAVAYLAACLAVILLTVAAVVINLPYVVLTPGPTVNALGSFGGQALIGVDGHRAYATDGHLNVVTFNYVGGAGGHVSLITVLGYLLSGQDRLAPQGSFSLQTQQTALSAAEVADYETAAALALLKIPFREMVIIDQTVPGLPAAAVLRPRDVLTAVDGQGGHEHRERRPADR